jgi:hypothetical protein
MGANAGSADRCGNRGHGPLLQDTTCRSAPWARMSGMLTDVEIAGMARSYTERESRAWPAPTKHHL